ncbi:hypothetical protein KODAMA_01350 [Serratia phage vB_SmaM-Kodama]|nr:hypothetical protein KODAMA_01350 [Serratia phage vB_SmaM-Kodama]
MTSKAFYIIAAIILVIGWAVVGYCIYDAFHQVSAWYIFGNVACAIMVFIWMGALIVAVGMQVKPTKMEHAHDKAGNY